jgi:hypothetical protein
MSFTVTLAMGAVLLAIWCDYRFEERRPGSLKSRMVHAAIAFGVLQLAAFAASWLLPDGAGHVRQLLVAFGVLLPGLVYAFVSAVWLMRVLAEVAAMSRR